MTTIREAFAIAMQHHHANRFEQAFQIYQQILQVDPQNVEALHAIGILAFQTGDCQFAIDYLRQAISISPDNADYRSNLGLVLSNAGQLDEAIQEYQCAIRLRPDLAEAYNNLGNALKDQGRFSDAIEAYDRAIALKSDFADAHNNRAVSQQKLGAWLASTDSLRRALALEPNYVEAHYNLAISMHRLGHGSAAEDSFRTTIALRPQYAEAHNGLGLVLLDSGKVAEAIASFQRATTIRPDYTDAYINLGSVCQLRNQPSAAIGYMQQALALRPNSAGIKIALAHQQQWACQWNGIEALTEQIIQSADKESSLQEQIPPFWFLCLTTPTSPEQQLRCARQWVKQKYFGSKPLTDRSRHTKSRPPKLKIGYLSCDFTTHATSWLIAELFEAHNRERFEIFGYSYGPSDHSPLRQRIENGFDHFRDIMLHSHTDSAAFIVKDKIDILVDLKGYTDRSRPEILEQRPAPIQVNYLGFPGTMGADFIDYILVDDFVVPAKEQSFFSERLIHLPGCYQVNDGKPREIGVTPTRKACGLPDDAFVFCSFNNSYKITPVMMDGWMRILKEVPESVLWQLDSSREACDNLRREVARRGVSPSRIVFAPRQALHDHLARHRLADLFLDTFPCNAHTTASDAIRMELPIVTLAGDTFASRVAGSILHCVGLPELVTYSMTDYEAIAIRLAQQPKELTAIRQRLSDNLPGSSLFDGHTFARRLEHAFETMWESHRTGELT